MSAWNLCFLILRHPIDAFDVIKRNLDSSKRSLTVLIIYAIYVALRIISIFTVGFSVSGRMPYEANLVLELAVSLLPILSWNVASYAFTSVIGGETKMSQIFTASAYSLVPYILITPIQIILSNFLTHKESAFYNVISVVVIGFTVLLLFLAYMSMNQYSFLKSLGTGIISLAVMVIMWAAILLIVSLTFQVYFSVVEIIKEILLLSLF